MLYEVITGIESGDMHRMVETANWLTYCLREIAKHVERADLLEELENLRRITSYNVCYTKLLRL